MDGLKPREPANWMIQGRSAVAALCAAATRAIAVALAAGVLVCCGCHLFRTSHDQVAAARQLSLAGIDAMQRGQWEEAEHQFEAAIDTCPTDERAHRHYAETLWHKGEVPAAIEHMEKAVELSGGEPALLVRLGEMRLAAGEVHRAADFARRAIEAAPDRAEAWALEGDVARAAGRPYDALAAYHRALAVEADSPQTQLAVAEIYYELNQPQRALATLQSMAENRSPEEASQRVLHLEGMALKSLGRNAAAAAVLARAAARGPATADLLFQLSEAQLMAGDPTNARLTLVQVLAIAPAHADGRRLMARIDSTRR